MREIVSKVLIALLLALTTTLAGAVVETYEFDDSVQELRYHQMVEELRCPKCQNQNLADSDAPIAADLRRELHRLLLEGRSDAEITSFMVDRYGEFVLYRPPLNSRTALLWLAPGLLLGVGALVLWRILRVQQRRQRNEAALTDSERERLAQLLADAPDNSRDESGVQR